jgi:hypothetical protein
MWCVGALCLVSPATIATAPLDADLRALAELPGEPRIVSAAGVTRGEAPLLTIENPSAFDPASTKLRLVIVGGLDGDARGAAAVMAAVRWMKRDAPKRIRDRWTVSALPMADPDGHARTRPFQFPPVKRFYEDPEQPESRYVWRWVAYQAPDLVVEFRGDGRRRGARRSPPLPRRTPGSKRRPVSSARDTRRSRSRFHAPAGARGPRSGRDRGRSPARRWTSRPARPRYPAAPSINFTPFAWINTSKLDADRRRRCAGGHGAGAALARR